MGVTPRHGRHTVYVGTLPDDCQPTTPVDLPHGLVNLTAHVEELTLSGAIAELRCFNRCQLESGIPGRRWAILAFVPRNGGAA